ncbi:hypothetical protein EX30DRAFT_128728 [Ascodesmis nigricans]|uniref:Uncharacterized protein n=1 Tax=Ascodesmis nigricans TaxID=341454 RepID=A0A4S2MRS1_9PEZI|nr:hypothetical protein EX30DRAFT_128728 [Ascodesmis nigricans]
MGVATGIILSFVSGVSVFFSVFFFFLIFAHIILCFFARHLLAPCYDDDLYDEVDMVGCVQRVVRCRVAEMAGELRMSSFFFYIYDFQCITFS